MKTSRTGSALRSSTLGAGLAGAGVLYLARRALALRRFDFNGRTVVLTGGSRGLGLVVARELVKQGARVALLARDPAELSRAGQDLERFGATALLIPCDVRDRTQVENAIGEVAQRLGGIDVLINNAGVIQVGPVDHMQLRDFAAAMDIHFWAPLYTMLAALPHMKRQGGGRIVNVSSIGGKVAAPHLAPYCSSKFALTGLSDSLRAELADAGISVTTVCPGLMRTGSHKNAQFKGRRQEEFAWFAIANALPIFSASEERAASQILDACRRGDAELVITWQAKLLVLANALAPNSVSAIMKVVNRLLPEQADESGDAIGTGWESQSDIAPSFLTKLSDEATPRNNKEPQDPGSHWTTE